MKAKEDEAWMGDGEGLEEANGVGMCSPMKSITQFQVKNPSHAPILPHQNGTMVKKAC